MHECTGPFTDEHSSCFSLMCIYRYVYMHKYIHFIYIQISVQSEIRSILLGIDNNYCDVL